MSLEQSLTTNQFGHWVEEVCRTYVALNVARVDDSPFRAGLDITHLGDHLVVLLERAALHGLYVRPGHVSSFARGSTGPIAGPPRSPARPATTPF